MAKSFQLLAHFGEVVDFAVVDDRSASVFSGKWLFAAQFTVSAQYYSAYWLLALVVGTTATGVYAACMSVVSVANPLLSGIGNSLAPKTVLTLQEGGGALLREVAWVSALLGGAMILFCLVLLFAGDDLMQVLYHGDEYAGHGQIIMALALAKLASAISIPPSIGLASIERPQAIVLAGVVGAVVTIVLVLCLMGRWGLFGAACGFLVGSVAAVVAQWVALLALVPQYARHPDLQTDPTVFDGQRVDPLGWGS